jgi:hypothetical protein
LFEEALRVHAAVAGQQQQHPSLVAELPASVLQGIGQDGAPQQRHPQWTLEEEGKSLAVLPAVIRSDCYSGVLAAASLILPLGPHEQSYKLINIRHAIFMSSMYPV